MKAALRLALALCTLQGTSALSLSYTEKLKLAEDIVKHSGNGPADPAFHSAIGRVYRATESSPNERAMVLDLAADRIPLHRSKQYAAVSKYLQGYALGLWEGRIGAKNKGDFTQSEFLRRGHFLTDDQAEWNRRSNIAIAQIGKMLRENKSLYDI